MAHHIELCKLSTVIM